MNVFTALVVELRTRGIPLVATQIRRTPPTDATRFLFLPDSNTTIVLQMFYDLITPVPFKMATPDQENVIPWALFEELVRAADVTVTNFGIHYETGEEGRMRLTRRLNATLSLFRQDRKDRPFACHLYRTTWHQHFLSHDGRFDNTTTGVLPGEARDRPDCVTTAAHEFEIDATLLAAYPDIPFLNFSSLTRDAGVFHRGTPSPGCSDGAGNCYYDCTHYCWSTAFFSPVWQLIGTAIEATC
jgi:hypothetical protein